MAKAKAKTKRSSNFRKAKGNLSKLFKKGKEEYRKNPSGFVNLPAGKYKAVLAGAEVRESGDNNWLHIQWTWLVLEGEHRGQQQTDATGLETEENFKWLCVRLGRLGVDTEDLDITSIDDVKEIISELVEAGIVIRIRVADSGQYTNVYVDASLEVGFDVAAFKEELGEDASEPSKEAEADYDDLSLKKLKALCKERDLEVKIGMNSKKLITLLETDDEASGDNGDGEDELIGKQGGFKKGKKWYSGEVISVDRDKETIQIQTETDKLVVGDLDAFEEAEPNSELEVGTRVSAEIEGDTYEGEVESIEEDIVTVKFDDGDVEEFGATDLTVLEASEPEAEVDLEEGGAVEVNYKGKTYEGIVKSFVGEDKAKVRIRKGNKKLVLTIPLEEVTALKEEIPF